MSFGFTRWLKRLYDWVVQWAESPNASYALFGIAFIESAFFPIAPDVLLIAMGVSQPARAIRFALICMVGSVIGGLFGYAIGYGFWSVFSGYFFDYVPGFTPEIFETVKLKFQEHSWMAIFAASFTPIPYKVFTIASGVAQIPVLVFISASIVGRGGRFIIIGSLLKVFGPSILRLIDKYFNWFAIAFTILFIGGFLAIKLL